MSATLSLSTLDTIRQVPLAEIRTDGNTQARAKIRQSVVRDYATAMKVQVQEDTWRFPPLVVFSDGQELWLADGFHRILAALEAGLFEILTEVRPGTQRDAVLFSISANTEHGFPRSNADKRNAVLLLLGDQEWRQWNDSEIARRCGVSIPLVSRLRKGASLTELKIGKRKVRRGTRVYEMDTGSIGPIAESNQIDGHAAAAGCQPPATDPLGLPLTGCMVDVFATLADFQVAKSLGAQFAQVIQRLAERPGGALFRQHLNRQLQGGKEVFHLPELRTVEQKLTQTAPYCSVCPYCHLAIEGLKNPACRACQGRGWITKPVFDACPDGHRRQILELSTASTPPIGEEPTEPTANTLRRPAE